jgi:quinol monooxygenase YgiN
VRSTTADARLRYTDNAALGKHESSAEYKKFFQTMAEEQLIAGPPTIVKGRFLDAVRT